MFVMGTNALLIIIHCKKNPKRHSLITKMKNSSLKGQISLVLVKGFLFTVLKNPISISMRQKKIGYSLLINNLSFRNLISI